MRFALRELTHAA